MGWKGHHNSRSQRADQATFGKTHRILDDIWYHLGKKQQERKDKNKKSMAFKATTKEEKEVEKEKESEKDEDLLSSQESSTSSWGVKFWIIYHLSFG